MADWDLDVTQLRAFTVTADTLSFTRAADRLGASQSTVSQRIRKLETRLGAALLDRTPRRVALTPFGARFLTAARRVIDAHDQAQSLAASGPARSVVRLGISDHAAGDRLAGALAWLSAATPAILWRVTVGGSESLRAALEAGALDLCVARGAVGDPEPPIIQDRLVWAARADLGYASITPEAPLPLVSLAGSCHVRDYSEAALTEAGVPFVAAFIGEGVAAVQAAVAAGLGVGCLDKRNLPAGAVDVGRLLGLPDPPATTMVVLSRSRDRRLSAALAAVRDAFRAEGAVADDAAAAAP